MRRHGLVLLVSLGFVAVTVFVIRRAALRPPCQERLGHENRRPSPSAPTVQPLEAAGKALQEVCGAQPHTMAHGLRSAPTRQAGLSEDFGALWDSEATRAAERSIHGGWASDARYFSKDEHWALIGDNHLLFLGLLRFVASEERTVSDLRRETPYESVQEWLGAEIDMTPERCGGTRRAALWAVQSRMNERIRETAAKMLWLLPPMTGAERAEVVDQIERETSTAVREALIYCLRVVMKDDPIVLATVMGYAFTETGKMGSASALEAVGYFLGAYGHTVDRRLAAPVYERALVEIERLVGVRRLQTEKDWALWTGVDILFCGFFLGQRRAEKGEYPRQPRNEYDRRLLRAAQRITVEGSQYCQGTLLSVFPFLNSNEGRDSLASIIKSCSGADRVLAVSMLVISDQPRGEAGLARASKLVKEMNPAPVELVAMVAGYERALKKRRKGRERMQEPEQEPGDVF